VHEHFSPTISLREDCRIESYNRMRWAMVWDVSFTCDICGRKKLEANHWWMLVLGDVPCFEEGQPGQRFTLLPWNKAESGNPDFYHLCGQGCAMQAMERFMNHGSIVSDGALQSAGESAASKLA
jgi:hypothetical protein